MTGAVDLEHVGDEQQQQQQQYGSGSEPAGSSDGPPPQQVVVLPRATAKLNNRRTNIRRKSSRNSPEKSRSPSPTKQENQQHQHQQQGGQRHGGVTAIATPGQPPQLEQQVSARSLLVDSRMMSVVSSVLTKDVGAKSFNVVEQAAPAAAKKPTQRDPSPADIERCLKAWSKSWSTKTALALTAEREAARLAASGNPVDTVAVPARIESFEQAAGSDARQLSHWASFASMRR